MITDTPKTINGVVKKLDDLEKTTLRSLTPAQASTLELSCHYNGELLKTDEVFEGTEGKFIQATVTAESDKIDTTNSGVSFYWSPYAQRMGIFKNYIFAIAYSNFYTSNDGGYTWVTGSGIGDRTSRIVYISDTVAYAVGISGNRNEDCRCTTGTDWTKGNFMTFPDTVDSSAAGSSKSTGAYQDYLDENNQKKTAFYFFNRIYSYYFKSTEHDTSSITWTKIDYPEGYTGNKFGYQLLDKIVVFIGNDVFWIVDGEWIYKGQTNISPSHNHNTLPAGNYIYCVIDGTVYVTRDGGLTWESTGVSYNSIASSYYVPTYCPDTGVYTLQGPIKFVKSSDGKTFSSPITTRESQATEIGACTTGSTIVCAGTNGTTIINTGTSYTCQLEPLSLNKSEVETAVGGVLPSQTGHSGEFLTTDGTDASWSSIPEELPSQSGNAGKVLSTDGTDPQWVTLATSSYDPVTQTITI